jgi:hypothetical protein
VDSPCEWSSLHTPSTGSGRDLAPDEAAVVLYVLAVAAHAPLVAVEDGGLGEVGVFAPVPVWLVALVVAFCAECGFVRPMWSCLVWLQKLKAYEAHQM